MRFVMDDKEKEKGKEDDKPSLIREITESFVKGRKIFLWSAVDDEAAEKIVKQMMFMDSQSHEDIFFFINSPGGVISSGLAIYDCMEALDSDVCTIVCGQAASMGAVLLAGGAAGKRFAWPHSRVMIHQPLISGNIFGPASDIEIQAEEMLRVRANINEILSKHSSKSLEQIEKDTDRDKWMTASEAKNYGLIDLVEAKR